MDVELSAVHQDPARLIIIITLLWDGTISIQDETHHFLAL